MFRANCFIWFSRSYENIRIRCFTPASSLSSTLRVHSDDVPINTTSGRFGGILDPYSSVRYGVDLVRAWLKLESTAV